MNRYKFVGTDIMVTYYAEKIHACCGATMLSGASFGFLPHVPDEVKKQKTENGVIPEVRKKFYKEWWEKQLSKASNADLNRSMICFVDAVGGEYVGSWPCLYELGVTMKGVHTPPIHNSRSGRKITTFALNRTVSPEYSHEITPIG